MRTERRPSGEEAESILKAKQEAPIEEGLMEKGIKGATEKYHFSCLHWFCSISPVGISYNFLNLEQSSGISQKFLCKDKLKRNNECFRNCSAYVKY